MPTNYAWLRDWGIGGEIQSSSGRGPSLAGKGSHEEYHRGERTQPEWFVALTIKGPISK